MKIKVINKSDNPLPKYETLLSSGMDVCSNEETFYLPAGERKLIKTGLFVSIPKGYEIQVRSRSGLTLKKGLVVLNGIGTIDADYRGEIGVILMNTNPCKECNTLRIEKGMKIAQLVLTPVIKCEWEEVEKLSETERGAGGYGSTEKN